MTSLHEALLAEIPALSAGRSIDDEFSALGLDSFDLLTLRSAVELVLGRAVDDPTWTALRTPADILALEASPRQRKHTLTRNYAIGMPQMAVGGLSESWLFKEIGDIHWQMITDGLGMPSSRLFDGQGNRLYATFTRIRMEHAQPLKAVRENAELEIGGSIARYGAGVFVGEFDCHGEGISITASVASSFSRRESADSNASLLRGQPTIPPDCPIPVLEAKPDFITGYQKARSDLANAKSAAFEREYRISPYHDINGVGLLYFAAYPIIADTCELDFRGGNSWSETASTVERDIFYFANSDADASLMFSANIDDTPDLAATEAIISRKGDQTPMALVRTKKMRL